MLLTYENEVVLTNEMYGAKALPYIVPKDNIRIACPISIVDKVGRCPGVWGLRAWKAIRPQAGI